MMSSSGARRTETTRGGHHVHGPDDPEPEGRRRQDELDPPPLGHAGPDGPARAAAGRRPAVADPGIWGPVATRQLDPAATIAAVLRGDRPHPEQVIHPTPLAGVDLVPGSRAATTYNTPDPHLADAEAQGTSATSLTRPAATMTWPCSTARPTSICAPGRRWRRATSWSSRSSRRTTAARGSSTSWSPWPASRRPATRSGSSAT